MYIYNEMENQMLIGKQLMASQVDTCGVGIVPTQTGPEASTMN